MKTYSECVGGSRTSGDCVVQRWVRVYLASAVCIFVFTAAAKLTADYTPEELLLRDPFISFLTARQLVFLVAFIELGVAALIAVNLKHSPMTGLCLALWLSVLFLLYRIGFMTAPESVRTVCRCFGGPGSILGKYSDLAAFVLLAYLLALGGVSVLLVRRSSRITHALRREHRGENA